MYTPSILETPLRPTGPVDATRPTDSLTADWPLVDDGQVQIGIWSCTPGRFTATTGDEHESMFMVAGRAAVQHEGGVHDLAPGTLWTTPAGWTSTWTVHQTVRKLYVIDQRTATPGAATHLSNASTAVLGEWTPRANPIAGTASSPVRPRCTSTARTARGSASSWCRAR